MTAHRMYNLTCANYDTCHEAYPGTIGVEDTTVKDLREQAAADGWEVMRGTHAGRDLGPECRMVEIDSAVKARNARLHSVDEAPPDDTAPDDTED